MLKKSVGLFGGGKWNGLGGKVIVGETSEQACVREVFEESGLRISNLRYHGILKFWFGSKLDWIVHVFSTYSFEGGLKESPEGMLMWKGLEKIPYGEMWEDDLHWLPLLLRGKSFEGEFFYDRGGTKLIDYKMAL